jgi:class 3 adenylate cyclase/tetratricopeptide (TPR) repeat protein
MKCPECATELPDGSKFCKECGKKLDLTCPGCQKPIPVDSKFCLECGQDLRKTGQSPPIDFGQPRSYTPKFLVEKILTSRSAIEGERKLVTVLFADVAEFTSMSEKLDPEDVHLIMDGCFKILMDEIHRFEGTVNEFRGDGLMALFGAPIAHEDHAQRACHAALASQRVLANYAEKLKRQHGVDFKVRVGLNSGAVVVGAIGDDLRMDYTAQGDTANLAARMETNAEPGKVLVSDNTYRLARDFFEFKAMGKIQVKGKQEPQEAYELLKPTEVVTRLEASVARGLKELVGREDELVALIQAFEKAKRGEAQVVDIVGEAGIGKSRLVYEFQKAVGNEATFLTGACVHYGRNMNFLPVLNVVRKAFGIEEGMTEEGATRRILARAEDGLAAMIPFYLNLLSLKVDDPGFKALDPEGRKYGTFEAVKNLIVAISGEKPLVVFLEDVHWIDRISEEFFGFFSRCILDHPILMLSASRPGCVPPWAQGAHYQRLGLETLSIASSIKLVRNMVGGLPLDPDLEKRVAAKTGGNPFFVEEIVRDLLDRRELVMGQDRYVSRRPIDHLQIPDTIQGVLAARMDRLGENLKRTMQVASVIGRDFAFRLLKSIMELGEELRTHLNNLVGLEVLHEKCLYPELEYIFKHALTQEVAYESLLKQRRREVHERTGQIIEEMYADRLEEYYDVLAHHYQRSGNPVKALHYLLLAGEKSNQRGAITSARELFEKALEIAQSSGLELNSMSRVRLHRGRASAALSMGDIGVASEGYRAVVELGRTHGTPDQERIGLMGLTNIAYMWHDKVAAEQVYQEAMAWARKNGDRILESVVLSCMGHREAIDGRRDRGNELVLAAEQIALQVGKPVPIFVARSVRSLTERWLGKPKTTIELTEGMIESLHRRFALVPLTVTCQNRGIALAEIGRIEDSMKVLGSGIEISEKFGASHRLGALYNSLGYCYSEVAQHSRALEFNRQGEKIARDLMTDYPAGRGLYAEMAAQAAVNSMENLHELGRTEEAWNRIKAFQEESKSSDFDLARDQWESRMNYLCARIMLDRGDYIAANEVIHENLPLVRSAGLKKREGCLLRLLGDLQITRGEFDAAISNMNQAIVLLKEVGNPRQLWQAHASLGSAFEQQGRLAEATEHWGAATETIMSVANRLSDKKLREDFLEAGQVREILSRSES